MQPNMRARDSTGDFGQYRELCLEPWTSGVEGKGVVCFLCAFWAVLSSAQQLPGLRCEAMRSDAIHEEFVKLPPRCD